MIHFQGLFLKFSLLLVFVGLTKFLHASIAVDDTKQLQSHRSKRETYSVCGPYNANETTRFIKLAFVVDNTLYQRLEKNTTKVNQRVKNIVNKLNSIFQKVGNIFLALVNVVIWNDRNKINVVKNVESTYNNFAEYAKLMINEHVDYVVLMTGIVFDNYYTIRYSSTDQMCTPLAFGVCKDNLTDVEIIVPYLSMMLAYGIGIPRDTDGCSCLTGNKCIMSGKFPKSLGWSNCSINSAASLLENRDYKTCLNNKPIKLYDGPVCGNSFTEPGEECDCGLPKLCDNSCCNATTCKFSTNATCATGECCDLESCKVRQSGVICRAVSEECDLAEHCDGESEFCPEDVFKNTGEWCHEGSKCDTSKHKCKETVYTYTHVCLENCYGNGICDSKGRCHCKEGFLPPLCRHINTTANVLSNDSINSISLGMDSNVDRDSNSNSIIMESKHYLFIITIMILAMTTMYFLLYAYYIIIPKWSLVRGMYRSQAKHHVYYDGVISNCSASSSAASAFSPDIASNTRFEDTRDQQSFEGRRFSNNTYASIHENSIYSDSKQGSNSSTKNPFLNSRKDSFCEAPE